uniref:Bromo domain-containing protein n=1 Tax=Nothobranchius furzeri TaxID=105023 RepID=A0A8C6MH34_NOTFU
TVARSGPLSRIGLQFPDSDSLLPEVCISSNRDSFEDDMNYEVQQAYKIFTSFLSDKHKGITGSFLHPIGRHETRHGDGEHQGRVQSQLRQSMCLKRIEEKFISQEYETITEFVADFRLMLENCYRYYGVDHWISKQAQKLETMMEQKLTLLSRTLREKTTLAMTSKGRFGAEEERGSGGTSTRKRQASRYFATATVGGHESVMVQTLRLEEQQRAKEEKRQRELEKKEAEEMSAKEVEDWEQGLLSQASPHTVDTVWELPAVGHFLCLAQTALNLPEIVFFELERCLLMPRCSLLLSKIMSSLLSPPQRRATLHRRPALPYRRWESELRQRILGWYRAIGASRDQPRRAEQLGLCHQFFSILGEASPLEEKPFHLLPFYQRVWLLKGLCDHVYETQRDVQDAVLAQPIHECRESILGYDGKENAYIHFPHFCGADLRIYCQSPSTPPAFPFPSVLVKRVETEAGTEGEESDVIKSEEDGNDEAQINSEECDFVKRTTETLIKNLEVKSEEVSPSQGHQMSPCLECCKNTASDAKSAGDIYCCSMSRLATPLSSESTQNSSEERVNDKSWTNKKKRKKKWAGEQLVGVKRERGHLLLHEETRLSQTEAAKSSAQKSATTIKRKEKKRKHKTVLSKERFTLVCSSLDELRELISKIEDELDELESMKKRLGRWYYKKEAVKELHSTLIRLLNELLPWEPKLVKACQRNRLPNTTEFVAKSAAEETCEPANHPKHPLTIKEKGVCTTTAESRRELKLEPIQMNQSRDPAWTPGLPAHLSLSPKYPILNLTGGLPKGYTPIPTLLAKSVGNKVTLMKRPQLSTKAAALPKPPQAKTSQSEQKSPVQVVYKAPEGFGHLVRKDNSNPVKMSVHSVLDQKTAEKVMQQVVFLPSNLLVKQTETKKPILNPKQSKGIQVTVSTVASPVCISTDVPGFSIPESNVTVQHVDTLKDAKPGKNLGPFFPLPLQKGTLNTVGYNETQVCNVQTTTPKGSVPTTSPVTTLPKVSADTVKLAEPKQELKTMCIRGSQSILVTTRGGNTGIVKVQTSSDHNTLGLFPTSPIITISPQLKAFLVSKALPTFSASAISQTPPSSASTVTSISTAQKYSPNPTNSTPTTLTGRIPLTGQDSQTTSANVALSPGPKISNCLMAETEISKLVPTSTSASSFPLGTCSSLPTSSPLQGVAAISGISQVSCTSSTGPGLLKGNLNQNDPCILTSISPRSSPVQVTNSAGGSPAQTWTSVLHPKPHFFKSTLHEEHVALPPSSQLAHNKTQTTLSFAPSTCASFPTLTTGTVQQKIIINTSTHLTAGTQIFLNNARFVVPPQGLGPGSHVLIISSPEPQVPTATHTITGPSVALKGQSPTNFTPLAPVLPQTSAKLPLVPAVSSSLVACTPALLPSAPHVTPFRLGASGLGSTQITSKTHAVSALPRFPSVHAGNFGSPSVCTSTLASSPPRLGSVPAVVSPVTTSAPALGSSLATIGIPAATITQTTSSSTIAPISTPLPKLSGALSSLPVFPSLSAGAFSSPVIPVSSPLCSVSAQTVTDAPCLPGQEMAGLMSLGPTTQPEQTGVRFAAPSTVHPQSLVQTGLGNSLIKNHLPVLQPVLSGTKTQILPPMSVPTIVNTVTRMKQLPVATVPPVGSTVSTFEMAPANMAAPASTAVLVSPVQPITSMASRNAIQRPVIPANKALRKDSVQISALGTHTRVPSKLLVSPDGAVLSTVQCRVNPANLNASPKPLDALVVSSNSSIGALQTHDSSLHPLRADTSEPTEQH